MATRRFNRLPPEVGIVLQVWGQRLCEQLEQALDDIEDQLASILAVTKTDAISASYTAPSAVLSAADAGSDVTITIAAHARLYGDSTEIDVEGGSVTGLAYSTVYAVYYDDTTRADTTPTYLATTNVKNAQNNYQDGRHLVGTVETPAAAGAPTSGGTSPPGSGYTPGGGAGREIP